jgi:CheY-like chemotaxis protein/two-component sensor histidine kinase
VARITQGKIALQKERLLLQDVVQRTVDAVRALVGEREQVLSVSIADPKIEVEADPMRLEQVLMNLLANAVKYGAAGNHIRLSAERQQSDVVLRVRDGGMGIAPEVLPRVFDLFVQGDCSLDRGQGGLGIGLTIVKRLVELHGGSVEAHSDGRGKGAEFVVRLPLVCANPEKSAARADERERQATAARVVIVEDNADSAESLSMLLELLGHQVVAVHDGDAGLAAARSHRPDVMLVDIGLPGMDGYEVARRMRADPELKHVVLVALTGYGQEDDRRKATAAGFDHHQVKPLDLRQLEGILSGAGEARSGSPTVH